MLNVATWLNVVFNLQMHRNIGHDCENCISVAICGFNVGVLVLMPRPLLRR